MRNRRSSAHRDAARAGRNVEHAPIRGEAVRDFDEGVGEQHGGGQIDGDGFRQLYGVAIFRAADRAVSSGVVDQV